MILTAFLSADWCYDGDEEDDEETGSGPPPPSYEESTHEDAFDDAKWLGAPATSRTGTTSARTCSCTIVTTKSPLIFAVGNYDEHYFESKCAIPSAGMRRGRNGMAATRERSTDSDDLPVVTDDTARNLVHFLFLLTLSLHT